MELSRDKSHGTQPVWRSLLGALDCPPDPASIQIHLLYAEDFWPEENVSLNPSSLAPGWLLPVETPAVDRREGESEARSLRPPVPSLKASGAWNIYLGALLLPRSLCFWIPVIASFPLPLQAWILASSFVISQRPACTFTNRSFAQLYSDYHNLPFFLFPLRSCLI